jgi:hypothetical protein
MFTEATARLLDIISDYDVSEEMARGKLEEFANEGPMIEAERANTDTRRLEVTWLLNSYLYAFEHQTMSVGACAERSGCQPAFHVLLNSG